MAPSIRTPFPFPIRNAVLASLPPADLARLRPMLRPVELAFDDALLTPGGIVEAVLFPESGVVSLLATLEDGEQVGVELVGREGFVGHPLAVGDDRSLGEVRVQVEGTALRIDAAALREELGASAALRGALRRHVLVSHAEAVLTAACNAHHPINERLARWLLIAHDSAGTDEFAMAQDAMAVMLGVRRPGVSLAAGVMQKAGLIQYARGRMAVTDRPGLEDASCGCYRAARRERARLLGPKPVHGAE